MLLKFASKMSFVTKETELTNTITTRNLVLVTEKNDDFLLFPFADLFAKASQNTPAK